MTDDSRDLRGKPGAASRYLLRRANRGGSRDEFLRDACTAILGFTGSDRLELWFEAASVLYAAHAMAGPSPSFRLSGPGAACGGEETTGAPSEPVPPDPVLGRLLPCVDATGRLAAHAARTAQGSLWLDGEAIVPFEIDSRDGGLLRLQSAEPSFFSLRLVESVESLAQLLGVAMAIRRAQSALTERVKELTCMYRIAQIAAESDLGLDETLQQLVEILPPAWLHPDVTTARIVLGERSFCSTGFREGRHRLSADVHVRGAQQGRVEVFYTGGRDDALVHGGPSSEDGPFLEEEHQLIQGVARELAFIIERRRAEEEKARLQEQIQHADRLATIGQLAAGVAHELNEPLGNILGFAQLARKAPNLADQTRLDIGRIVTASLYAREIIKKLMFFARQTPARRTAVDLNRVLRDGLALLESRCATARIDVQCDLAPDLPAIHGDPAQLQQVVVNLAVNAVQAMPEGGSLRMTTTRESDAVCMACADTGAGIPAADLERIFLPFFTTKDVGQGTGLGLSVIHGIVTSHGGAVRVESELGRGTRFEIRLPAGDAAEVGPDAR